MGGFIGRLKDRGSRIVDKAQNRVAQQYDEQPPMLAKALFETDDQNGLPKMNDER
jgi:hypothetical protein